MEKQARATGKISLAVTTVLLLLWTCQAHSSSLTLRQCIIEALRNSPAMNAGAFDTEAAREEITRKRATTLPYLRGGLDTYEVNGAPLTPFEVLNVFEPGNGGGRNAHWGPAAIQSLQMSVPVFQYGSILGLNHPPVVEIARTQASQQEWTNVLTQEKVVQQVATAFFTAQSFEKQAATLRELSEVLQRISDIMRQDAAYGLKLQQDLELAESQLSASEHNAVAANNNARFAIMQLLVLLGLLGDELVRLANENGPVRALPPVAELLSDIVHRHPAIRIQQHNVDIAFQQARIERANLWPTASIQTIAGAGEDLNYIDGGSRHRRPTLFMTGLQVEIPLFDFGQRRAAVRQAEAKVNSARARLKEVELELRTAIIQLYSDISGLDQQVRILQTDYLKAYNAAQLAQERRGQGAADELTYLQAESAMLVARLSLQSIALKKALKYAELTEASGGVWDWME